MVTAFQGWSQAAEKHSLRRGGYATTPTLPFASVLIGWLPRVNDLAISRHQELYHNVLGVLFVCVCRSQHARRRRKMMMH